jgi:hypothetical protein
MAFDQTTRNRLQRFVNDARRLLTEEFTRQLQNDYGLDPTSGTVTPLENLRHLNDTQRETARILRDTLAHYCASQEADAQTGLDRIVREQAFTVLNRLAALRMAEARGLLIESVGNSYQAKGFQLYTHLIGTGLGETGDAYRIYLFSIFDELAQDLPGLFDRYSPQGRLFPREAAVLPLLALINDADIEPLWGEDETIGWIYQYFNSKEERKAMRDASQAPRNSRELAVRNQFFTPRYVVEFLVDNTLGRLWFNATGGKSALAGRCQYLLVKPDELPVAASRLRDPRTLKLLDPACGSMHFGLYAFDLFLEIYREAWDWEQEHGPGSLDISTQPSAHFKPLNQTYADQASFLHDVPRLIIEHNIYGVDIDPRAAQIASLALWLRAQRAWHEADVKAKNRPLIGRGNVVAAVAPPAERVLRQQFTDGLDDQDAELFEKTLQLLKRLPELGVLLRIEIELPHLIRHIYGEHGPMFNEADKEQWQKAEARLRQALNEFATESKSTYQGRLFAQDALQGLRLIDITGERFDVVLMNPPFGLAPKELQKDINQTYPRSYVDLYACFVSRGIELCRGRYGAITSRSLLVTKRLERLRSQEFLPRLDVLLDLGWPVMDGATVQSAAYVLECMNIALPESFIAIDRKMSADKSTALNGIVASVNAGSSTDLEIDKRVIRDIPRQKLLYSLPKDVLRLFSNMTPLKPALLAVKQGMTTFDDSRFVRLRWEVQAGSIGRDRKWVPLAKGGSYARFYSKLPLVVHWNKDGAELAEVNKQVNGQTAQARQASSFYFIPGGTYSKRNKDFGVRVLPQGFIMGAKGPAILAAESHSSYFVIGVLNSRLINCLINLQANAKQYDPGLIEGLPYRSFDKDSVRRIEVAVEYAARTKRELSSLFETEAFFISPVKMQSFSGAVEETLRLMNDALRCEDKTIEVLNAVVDQCYGVDSTALPLLIEQERDDDEEVDDDADDDLTGETVQYSVKQVASDIASYLFGLAIGRWKLIPDDKRAEVVNERDLFSELPIEPPSISQDHTSGFSIIAIDSSQVGDFRELLRRNIQAFAEESALDQFEHELAEALGGRSLDEYFIRPNGFFANHLVRYSESRRQAPIYWPLSTTSGSYTLWLYYPSLSSQTLYTAINDFVEPRLKHVGGDVAALRNKGTARSRDDERQFETLQAFELELIELRDTLLNIAQHYHPNHDDGVQITAAPLWPLFRHKPWQKVLKDTWAKLEKGDYDWAHLAMNYWPARVREKCKTDKSLAIAHGLEELYVEPAAIPKKTRGRKKGIENE